MSDMNDYIFKLTRYLENLLGEHVVVNPLDETTTSCLPIYITGSYKLFSMKLLGKDIILLYSINEMMFAPAQIKKQKELVENKVGTTAVFAFDVVASYNLQRLIAQRINYIIPGKQLFIPDMLMDLRSLKGNRNNDREAIPAMAQCIVLYHLQIASLNNKTAQELAELFSVSYPNINRALRWLRERGFIALNGGKTKNISFNHSRNVLWDNIKHDLVNPIDRVLYTDEVSYDANVAGVNALAQYTMINNEPSETYAISKDEFKQLSISTDKEFGANRIEIWKYSPKHLSNNGIVDKISLFLTLKDSDDERIQIELESMINNMTWYTE